MEEASRYTTANDKHLSTHKCDLIHRARDRRHRRAGRAGLGRPKARCARAALLAPLRRRSADRAGDARRLGGSGLVLVSRAGTADVHQAAHCFEVMGHWAPDALDGRLLGRELPSWARVALFFARMCLEILERAGRTAGGQLQTVIPERARLDRLHRAFAVEPL